MDPTRNVIGGNIIYCTPKVPKNYLESLGTISPCHRLSTSYDYIHTHTHTYIYIYINIFVCVCVCMCSCTTNYLLCTLKKKKTKLVFWLFFFNIFRVQLCLLYVLIKKKMMFPHAFFFLLIIQHIQPNTR